VTQDSPINDEKGFPVVHITISLKSLPVIGKDPITPQRVSGTDVIPTVCLSLRKSDIPRFRQALHSRSMVCCSFTGK
jgi:hypothetical protein